ncbi:glycerophosphodiester phosphodiesterase [Paenibacillus sp. J5C_2022]|uniref:glycerophosphodiester phosphodiesterase n=1 Tax=Paenibacillus sp. J5C2022 TaxID=2977129 RepID=UPI0021D03D5A|nr:glycerophosphodiester phosphodiesterase [Paenibacillus sp. J5C2022]MCU6708366.1 glycerophosphodiester phosphodiesterase [Paenibacillus sp. J5C2022]
MVKKNMLVIAHRGASGEAPENTLGAFKLGLEQGCDAIELDVHLSREGEVVVCHDATLKRTTDREGTIRELTVDELKRADAGLWFHESFKGERIPLMEEVFDLVPPGVMINIEMKDSYSGAMEPALLALMKRKNRLDDVVVSSFDHKCLYKLKQLEPDVKIGLLYTMNPRTHAGFAQTFGLPVYSLHPHKAHVSEADVREAARSNLHVYPYTINDEATMRQYMDNGVSGIITDFPGKLRKLLESVEG